MKFPTTVITAAAVGVIGIGLATSLTVDHVSQEPTQAPVVTSPIPTPNVFLDQYQEFLKTGQLPAGEARAYTDDPMGVPTK